MANRQRVEKIERKMRILIAKATMALKAHCALLNFFWQQNFKKNFLATKLPVLRGSTYAGEQNICLD